MLFIAHLVACVWFAVGRSNTKESWLISIAHDPACKPNDETMLQYIRSVYWAIITMTTIGYGDIVARNNAERLLNITVMAVGVSFFGYVIGTISTLVTNLDVTVARYDERMTLVKEYIISHRMPKHIGNKIRHHFEYYYQNRSVFNETQILKRLPNALRNDMIHQVHSKIVSSVKYFVRCPDSLISDLVMAMRPFAMLKDEYIYVEREIAAHVFFILKGKVQLVKTATRGKDDIRLSTMSVGDHFGELEVYDHEHGNGVRICSAVAKSYSELTFLSREAIQKISLSWPEVTKHFRESAGASLTNMRRRADSSAFQSSTQPVSRLPLFPKSADFPEVVIKTSIANISSRPARVTPLMSPSVKPEATTLPRLDDEKCTHAWSETEEVPLINAVNALMRPYKSIAQGRKATLRALPGTISEAKAPPKLGILEPLSSKRAKYSEREESSTNSLEVLADAGAIPESLTPSTDTTIQAPAVPEKELSSPQTTEEMVENRDEDRGHASRASAAEETELHDMIAKIRDSPHEQQKRSLKSERIMLRGTYLFHPQEPFIVLWQFLIGLGIVYSIIVVPFRLGYNLDAQGTWYVLEMIIDGFFFVDIILNFRTAYFDDERKLIYNPRTLFWRYIKGWFLLDLVSTVPIDEVFQAAVGTSNQTIRLFPTKLLRLFRIARLLKLTRLIKLSRVFGRIRDTVQLSPSTERLFKLLMIMSIFCHWNACVFHGVMLVSESAGYHTWCVDAFFPNEPLLIQCSDRVPIADRYIAAVYWAFTTLTTVGYGDVKPSLHSPYELVVVIILVVVNATVFGYIISSVMTLIRNLDPSDREYRLLMTEMKDYLRYSSVGERLYANVKTHYHHHIECTSLFPEQKLFDKMAPNLRFDVARLVAVETLFSIPLITVMEDSFKGFVSYALFLMKPVCIQRGECHLENSVTNLGRIIGENAVFEQYALMAQPDELYRTVSTATVISSKCILYSLTIPDFKILENISPAVSTYFLSQLASVLVADDMLSMLPHQRTNLHLALRRGENFRAMAEQSHGRVKFKDLSKVALASLHRRRDSEWSPELLPNQLQKLAETESKVPEKEARKPELDKVFEMDHP